MQAGPKSIDQRKGLGNRNKQTKGKSLEAINAATADERQSSTGCPGHKRKENKGTWNVVISQRETSHTRTPKPARGNPEEL